MGREALSVGWLHGPQWAGHMGKVPDGGLTPVARRGLGVKGGTKSSLPPSQLVASAQLVQSHCSP